jgi:NRPS condensation-like uncharacterized protein
MNIDSKPSGWMPLDNAAHIYPAARSRNWTALFRVSMELTEPVDPEILKEAQRRTLKRFPGFAVRLRRGMFWHYFELQDGEPDIQLDVQNPCVRMNLRENKGFMFRVRYYEKRIAVEIFHVITDGTGGMCFLKTLVAEYLRLKYGATIPGNDEILDCSVDAQPCELEDSFIKYARKATLPRGESSAYRLRGFKEEMHVTHLVTGMIDAEQLHAKAQSLNASVGELLTTLLILAIRRVQQGEHGKRRRLAPVKICVPVNMRKFYPTCTMRNFASYVNPGIEPKYGEYSLEETIGIVKHYMALEATEKKLNAKFSTNVQSGRNHFLRATPLFLKNTTLKIVFKLTGDKQTCAVLSNLGTTKLPEEMQKYVSRIDFIVGPLSYNPVTCACIAYNGLLCVNFMRTIRESYVERYFFTSLVKLGIHVKIESNQLMMLRGDN